MKKLSKSQWRNIISGVLGLAGLILQGFGVEWAPGQIDLIVNFALMIIGGLGMMTNDPVKPPNPLKKNGHLPLWVWMILLLPLIPTPQGCSTSSEKWKDIGRTVVKEVALPYLVAEYVEDHPDTRSELSGLALTLRSFDTLLDPASVQGVLLDYVESQASLDPPEAQALRGLVAVVVRAYNVVWAENGGEILPEQYRGVLVKLADIIDRSMLFVPAADDGPERYRAGRVILEFVYEPPSGQPLPVTP